jgi:phospholipid/cholesterol/gamma-HCH transport system substrate-binding protein
MAMSKMSAEAKVGLFVCIGLVILVYMSLRVGGMKFGVEKGYTLTALVASAEGLDEAASVRVAGVEVGRIEDIELYNNKARLILHMFPDSIIGRDFTASLKTKGLLGEKYLNLSPGELGSPPLKDGEEITNVIKYANIEELVTIIAGVGRDVKEVSSSLKNVLGGEEGSGTLKSIVENIEEITFRINDLVADNDEELSMALANFAEFSDSMKGVSESLSDVIEQNRGKLSESITSLRAASAKFEDSMTALSEIKPKLERTATSLENITAKLDSGKGTLGKLINDDTTHKKINKTLTGINRFIEKTESFRMYVGYRAEYLIDNKNAKSYLSLRIQPKKDKYYLIEVVDDPQGLRDTKTVEVGGVSTKIVTTKEKIKISAQIAKRFKNVVLRGGLIESSGGAGIDYFALNDDLKLTFEAFDFDEDRDPHLKAGITYLFAKYFYVTFGYDDIISDMGLESAYVGLGFHFEDDDIKYLLSGAPVSF